MASKKETPIHRVTVLAFNTFFVVRPRKRSFNSKIASTNIGNETYFGILCPLKYTVRKL